MSHIIDYSIPRLPPRRSLAYIGIPDHRDRLAVSIRWTRQAHYRAHPRGRGRVASSAKSQSGETSGMTQTLPPNASIPFDKVRISNEVYGAGAGFDDMDPLSYPSELDLVG